MGLKYYLRGLGVGIVVTALIMGIATNVQKETLSDEEIKERARALGMVEKSTVLADTIGQEGQNPGNGEEDPVQLPASEEEKQETGSDPEKMSEMEETGPDSSADPQESASASASPVKTPETSAVPTATPEAAPTATKEPTPVPTATPQKKVEPEKTPEKTPEATATPKASQTPSPKATATPKATPTPTAEPDTSAQEAEKEQEGGVSIHVEGGESSFTVCRKLEQAGLVTSASEFDTYLCQNGYDKKIRAGSFEIPAGASQEQIAKIITKTN